MYTSTYDVSLIVIHILTVACIVHKSLKEGQHTILQKLKEVLIKDMAVELGI